MGFLAANKQSDLTKMIPSEELLFSPYWSNNKSSSCDVGVFKNFRSPRPHENMKTAFSKNSTLGSIFKKLRCR